MKFVVNTGTGKITGQKTKWKNRSLWKVIK